MEKPRKKMPSFSEFERGLRAAQAQKQRIMEEKLEAREKLEAENKQLQRWEAAGYMHERRTKYLRKKRRHRRR